LFIGWLVNLIEWFAVAILARYLPVLVQPHMESNDIIHKKRLQRTANHSKGLFGICFIYPIHLATQQVFCNATTPKHSFGFLLKQGKEEVRMERQGRVKKKGPTPFFPTLFFPSLTAQWKEPQNCQYFGIVVAPKVGY